MSKKTDEDWGKHADSLSAIIAKQEAIIVELELQNERLKQWGRGAFLLIDDLYQRRETGLMALGAVWADAPKLIRPKR